MGRLWTSTRSAAIFDYRLTSRVLARDSAIIFCAMPNPATILELADTLRAHKLSPVELTRACLQKIEELNPVLNAFITVTADQALAQARAAEAEILRGDWRGPLHGIPIGLKDLIDTAGIPTTAASELYRTRIPAKSAEVVLKLERGRAIFLGKQNLHEFAYGGGSMISCFGEVHNPWNPGVHRRRLFGRISLRSRSRAELRSHRDRHGRLHPRTSSTLRHRRIETNLRARGHARRDSIVRIGSTTSAQSPPLWRTPP